MQMHEGHPVTGYPALESPAKVTACSWLCALSVGTALVLGVAAIPGQPAQPDFAQQLRGLRGVSSLNVGRDELTSSDVTQLVNAAAEQRRQALRKDRNGNASNVHLVTTAHHQVRSGS
jgi:hypothetical protein